jgi:hypothetical protein
VCVCARARVRAPMHACVILCVRVHVCMSVCAMVRACTWYLPSHFTLVLHPWSSSACGCALCHSLYVGAAVPAGNWNGQRPVGRCQSGACATAPGYVSGVATTGMQSESQRCVSPGNESHARCDLAGRHRRNGTADGCPRLWHEHITGKKLLLQSGLSSRNAEFGFMVAKDPGMTLKVGVYGRKAGRGVLRMPVHKRKRQGVMTEFVPNT